MNTSPKIEHVLSSFRLDEREQNIYLAALELGQSLQSPLAEKAGLKRTSFRELLPGLLKRGILKQIVHGRRKYLVATAPSDMVAGLESAMQNAKSALPELIALQNILEEKPKVYFYEGIEGVKKIYIQTLEENKPIYSFINISSINSEIRTWLLECYVQEREKRQITAYGIVNEDPGIKEMFLDNRYRKSKIVPKEKFPYKMEINIFGDWVAYIHFRKEESPSGVLIKSENAAETMRSIHKQLWEAI